MIYKSVWGITGVALAGALSLTVSAQAADLGRTERYEGGYKDGPVYTGRWDGFYLGAHVGGAWGDVDIKDLDYTGDAYGLSPSGAFGGGTIGYNFQAGHLVLGFEADLGVMDLNATKDVLGGTETASLDGGLYGDVTGRLGYAFDRTMLYAKAGYAFFDGEGVQSYNGFTMTGTDTFSGWTVGGGVEHFLTPAWSVKAEYQHFDFGTQTALQTSARGTNFRYDFDVTADTVKAGVNYHFGRGYEPLK